MNLQIPENQTVLSYLSRKGPKELLVSPADSTHDPYRELGSHPDTVERVWDELGTALSPTSCQVVCGNPALVHPITGAVFAPTLGTRYVVRLPPEIAKQAKRDGFRTMHTWSDGRSINIEAELGPGWIFNQWSPLELAWLKKSYAPFHGSA
jgi:hypothetical protein